MPLQADARLFEYPSDDGRTADEVSDQDTLRYELKVTCTMNPQAPKNSHLPEDMYRNSKGSTWLNFCRFILGIPRMFWNIQLHCVCLCTGGWGERKIYIYGITYSISFAVYSKDIKWVPIGRQAEMFPHGAEQMNMLEPEILICKLRPGQEIHAFMHAVKGIGSDHAKFSPVGMKKILQMLLQLNVFFFFLIRRAFFNYSK